MDVRILGIDLGKNSCSLVGLDAAGRVVVRRRMRRDGIAAFAAKAPGCIVAMEACCGAHHLGRLLATQGHEVRLMSPEYVRPYVKAQKNDDRDAEAIAEAATRPTMRFVALKSEAQLDVQSLLRGATGWSGERTALTNQIQTSARARDRVRQAASCGRLLRCLGTGAWSQPAPTLLETCGAMARPGPPHQGSWTTSSRHGPRRTRPLAPGDRARHRC
jgi:transposase